MMDDDDLIDQFLADEEAQRQLDIQIQEREEKRRRRPKIDEERQNNWVYPYDPTRDQRQYQYEISHASLFNNTLVCLPTGLGKTLIASVVMYNMYRWFQTGKILFVAPSVSLVMQQYRACTSTIDFKESDVVAITGSVRSEKRSGLWKEKRIFFCIASCIVNDMKNNMIPTDDIVLVVVDEAHRATGDHDYCKLIRMLYEKTSFFRVLGLTATPGKDLPTIQKVITNLNINHVEVRSESDLKQYTHDKAIVVEQCPLTEPIQELESMFVRLVTSLIDMLFNYKAYFERDPRRVTHQALRQAMISYLGSGRGRGNYMATSVFTLAISLYHAYSDLLTQGIYAFIKSLEKIELANQTANKNNKLRNSIFGQPLFHDMKRKAKDFLEKHKHEHPKIVRLIQIVKDHFRRKEVLNEKTRVIIFANKKQTVRYITQVLSKLPGNLIKAMEFLGHNKSGQVAGLTSKEQKEVISKFSQGKYNTLVSTSVGEEGLDIGEVDMIICFDAVSSPTRMIQRMGRTGRKRDGVAVMILSEGMESETYRRSVERAEVLFEQMKKIPTSKGVRFFDGAMRMVPHGVEPSCITQDLRPTKSRVNISPQKSHNRKQPMITTTELKYLYNNYGSNNFVVPGRYANHLKTSFGRYVSKPTPSYDIRHSDCLKSLLVGSRNRLDPTYDWGAHQITPPNLTPRNIRLNVHEIEMEAIMELEAEDKLKMEMVVSTMSPEETLSDEHEERDKEQNIEYLQTVNHQPMETHPENDSNEGWGCDENPNVVVTMHASSGNESLDDLGELLDLPSSFTPFSSSTSSAPVNHAKRSREHQQEVLVSNKKKRYL